MMPFPGSELPPERRLREEHRQHLHDSGLTDGTIQQAGLASLNEAQTRLLGYPDGLRGIGIPYPDTEIRVGENAVPYTRLRVDADRVRSEGQKYENPLASRMREGLTFYPYIPPEVASVWKDAKREVVITEGEKKALALTQAGIPAIGLPGVFMFTDPESALDPAEKPLHPQLRSWRWRHRPVAVCFDSDRIEKEGVAIAHERLCRLLVSAGARVRVVVIPPAEDGKKVGADDVLVHDGSDVLHGLVARAAPWAPFHYLLEMLAPNLNVEALPAALERARHVLAGATRGERRTLAAALRERFPTLTEDDAIELLSGDIDPAGLSTIVVTHRQTRAVVTDAWSALLASPYGSRLFDYGGKLVDVLPGSTRLRDCDSDRLSAMLNRSATWVSGSGSKAKDAKLPPEIVRDMRALVDGRIPRLEALVHLPVLRADGTVNLEDGYDPESRLLCVADPRVNAAVGLLEMVPSSQARVEALDLLRTELLGDFTFPAASHRAHALAALILPAVRHMIAGTTALHMIEAPTPGCGKGLLADVIAILATGASSKPMSVPQSDDEVRKRIASSLLNAPGIMHLDNINHPLDSASLASVLTADPWEDRLLGKSEMLTLRNRSLWLATANNPVLSRELARRTVRVRLDPDVEMPWLRAAFRHADLRSWAKARRPELACAVITLVRGWIADGRPPGPVRLGSFEAWSEVIGGILGSAGVAGFLAVRDEFSTVVDPEEAEWRQLLSFWEAEFGTELVDVGQIMELAAAHDVCRVDARMGSPKIAFGRALASRRDRRYDGTAIRVDYVRMSTRDPSTTPDNLAAA